MMEKHRAKKSMGQNFLTDRNVLRQIVAAVDVHPEDHILEIGPGKGALTSCLAEKGAQLLAIELDMQLLPLLKAKFSENHQVELVQGDVLKVDLQKLLSERWRGTWKVAANLPYNISSQVLFKFLDNPRLFSLLVLMLQKEVGDRLVASPGSKEYGILSVFCQLHFDINRVTVVKPGSFHPIPKVDSVVLRFVPLAAPRVEVADEPLFRKVVKASFSQRRKTLLNCLKSSGILTAETEYSVILDRCHIDGNRRGETLSLQEFAILSNALFSLEMSKRVYQRV